MRAQGYAVERMSLLTTRGWMWLSVSALARGPMVTDSSATKGQKRRERLLACMTAGYASHCGRIVAMRRLTIRGNPHKRQPARMRGWSGSKWQKVRLAFGAATQYRGRESQDQ
jgi:hypothetical protein